MPSVVDEATDLLAEADSLLLLLTEAGLRPAAKVAQASTADLDTTVDRDRKSLGKLWSKAVRAFGSQVVAALKSGKLKPASILRRQAEFELDLEPLVAGLTRGAEKAYKDGQGEARQVLARTRKSGEAARVVREEAAPEELTPQDVLSILQSRSMVVAVGMERQVMDAITSVLLNGFDGGLSDLELQATLDRVLTALAAGQLIAPGTPGYDYSQPAIQATTVRTTYASAMNRGRMEVYQRAADFVRAMEIGEVAGGRDGERSHPLSKHLHGLVIALDDPRLRRLTPPNHYNDRAVFIPVTVLDDGIQLSTDAEIDRALAKKAELSPNFS